MRERQGQCKIILTRYIKESQESHLKHIKIYACPICLKDSKPPKSEYYGPLQMVISETIDSRAQMDIVDMWRKVVNNCKWVLRYVDHHSGFLNVACLTNKKELLWILSTAVSPDILLSEMEGNSYAYVFAWLGSILTQLEFLKANQVSHLHRVVWREAMHDSWEASKNGVTKILVRVGLRLVHTLWMHRWISDLQDLRITSLPVEFTMINTVAPKLNTTMIQHYSKLRGLNIKVRGSKRLNCKS